ncbi:unnamed protein product [Sphagnum jensenii]|uniref:AIR9-like A9 domain-containing protein n=1 Tax=Sphagnum jensenii TaxID=128206 RepID=A0ABP1C2H7_9BRYO
MAYRGSAEASRRGDYRRGGGGGNMPEQADARSGSGPVVTDIQNRLRSVELAPRPRSSEQELVDTIDIADSTIRAQVEEIAQLRSSLRKAEWELQYNKLGKQDASNLYTISPPPSQVLSARVPQAAGGQGHNLGMPSLSEYQNGTVSSPGDTSSSAQLHMPSNGVRNGVVATNGGHNGRAHGTQVMENGNNRLNRQTSSVSPRMGRRHHETDFWRPSSAGQGFSSDMAETTNSHFSNHQQDMTVMNSRNSEDFDSQLRKQLAEASMKEAQLISEKRILEHRVAELRRTHDQMQQGLVDAAFKALSYRQDILEENIRLTYAVQLAEQEKNTYVQSLMPLLSEFDLQPPVTDAQSMVSHVKVRCHLFLHLLLIYDLDGTAKVKDSQYYTPYPPSFQPSRPSTPLPPFQENGFEIVPSFSLQPTLPIQTPQAGPPLERGALPPQSQNEKPSGNNQRQRLLSDHQQHPNSQAPVWHESMGGQAPERFGDPEGYVPPPRGHEQESHLDRVYAGPHLPNLTERPNFSSTAEGDSLPGIEGLIIVGDAVLGGRLTACGYPVNGTTLCIFQWVRHLPDGSRTDIEGAGQPEYMITADDCDIKLAIDCVPMDEMGRRGELVMVMANDGRSISQGQCYPMMKDQIVSYITNGYASFDGQFLEGPSEEPLEPAVLILRRSTYELRRTDSRKVISEKYAADVSIEIPVGPLIQCVIKSHDGRRSSFALWDARRRDAAVLTFRAFLKTAVDEQKKKKHKWLHH